MSNPALLVREIESLLEANPTSARDDFLMAADSFRRFVRQGDNLLHAISEVVAKVNEAHEAAKSGDVPIRRRRAVSYASDAVRRVAETAAPMYTVFEEGRTRLYRAIDAWNVDLGRKDYGDPEAQLKRVSPGSLWKDIRERTEELNETVPELLDWGAFAQREIRSRAARGEKMADHAQDDMIEAAFDFKDLASLVFLRTHGVMRRVVELSRRLWNEELYEAEAADDSGVLWRSPWAADPEFGGRE